jgi:hypothetical protein
MPSPRSISYGKAGWRSTNASNRRDDMVGIFFISLLEKITESCVNAPITLPIPCGCTSATGAFYRLGRHRFLHDLAEHLCHT